MALLLKTHLDLAKASLRRNRTRSFLTCLGISIGVAAIILILSLMGSIKTLIHSQALNLGSNLIVVRPSVKKDAVKTIMDELTFTSTFQKSNLTLDDIKIINAIERESGTPVSEDCMKLIEFCIRYGCVLMEQTVGKNWRASA